MGTVTIDRHVLASSASSINLAWRSFGWSPAIAGARATRLEEEIPWGSLADRSVDPGWLSGTPASIVEARNMDRLQWAMLPMDGRLGLSVWGASGSRDAAAGSRRVLTHTLLFDESTFVRLAGYPFGLFGTPARPPGWLKGFEPPDAFATPAGLEAIRLTASPALTRAFETARIAEVRRLTAALTALLGGDGYELAYRIGGIHEALAGAVSVPDGARIDRVALRDDWPGAALLVRLAWLSLPLADRVRTWFITEQARTERPRAHLMVLPIMEWGRSSPAATQVVDPDVPDAMGAPATGRARWAVGVVGPEEQRAPVSVLRRADVRGWSVLGEGAARAGEGLALASLLDELRRNGPGGDLVQRLVDVELERRRPRWRGIGACLARQAIAQPGDVQTLAEALVDRVGALPEAHGHLLGGAVRRLLRTDVRGQEMAGFVRCFGCLKRLTPADADWMRLGLEERLALDALLEHPDGLGAVVLAGTAIRERSTPSGPGPAAIAHRLAEPPVVARALGSGTRIPTAPFLDLLEWGRASGGVSVAGVGLLAAGIDGTGPSGLEPEMLPVLIERIGSVEATEALLRTWHDTLGNAAARLQVASHPGWPPHVRGRVYGFARAVIGSEAVTHGESDGAPELLRPWSSAVAGGKRLEGPEAELVAELVWRRAELGQWTSDPGLGEAVAVGQTVGGEVLGSPAVSPFHDADALVHALSPSGLARLLERSGDPSGTPLHAWLRSAVLASPSVGDLRAPPALDRLCRHLWSEWTPDRGLPSLRRAAVLHGVALAPLLEALRTVAPIPLESLFRAMARELMSPDTRIPERADASHVFLRSGGAA